jgi:hypothetical protein
MPQRIQLSRRKGWTKPPTCVVVSRPSVFGNPFIAGVHGSTPQCVAMYRRWVLRSSSGAATRIRQRLDELRGKDLVCWCKPESPCHADVLLELANR